MSDKGHISELVQDDKNFNKHSEYGMGLLEKSVSKFGMGRSILVDKNNKIIAGNGITETAGNVGIEKVKFVDTDGTEIIAVRRKDIDLDTPEGREMALADNATGKANLQWDEENLGEVCEEFGIDAGEWGVEDWKPMDEAEVQEDDFNEDGVIEVRCKKGDVWELGDHRLMCGDSVDLEQVKTLMGGGIK